MKVVIPFRPEFGERMRSGAKTWTTRSERYGYPGDTFDAFDRTFELVKVEPMKLGQVATLGHKREGFASAQEFIDCWNELHPRRRYRPADVKFVHQFRLVSRDGGSHGRRVGR